MKNFSKPSIEWQIAKSLQQSELWLVLRLDEQGLHVHGPEEDATVLLGMFFAAFPDMLEAVVEFSKTQEAQEFRDSITSKKRFA